jgi:hypothetical protein
MFLRDEVVKYSVDRFGTGPDDLDERARILGFGQRYVNRSEIAARWGVDKHFVNRILTKGSVDTIRVEGSGGRSRLLIDMSAVTIPFSPAGKIYNSGRAAEVIGIPRKTLAS